MAVLGIGIDIVELGRIESLYERSGEAFLRKICREGEVEARKGHALIEHIGGLFAAKEAALKALGTGWAEGLGLSQIEIRRRESGAPYLTFHDAAEARARALGVETLHLTISHERSYAVAMVVLEGS